MSQTETGQEGATGLLASRAAELFAAGADYERALLAATRRAVPEFADWCVVDYYAADGELRAVHSGHPKQGLMLSLRERYREQRGEEGEILTARRTGEPLLYTDTTKVVPFNFGPEDMAVMREIGATSSIVVPMHEQGSPLGVISFVSMHRHYAIDDLAAAEEFAAGCARVLSQSRRRAEIERSLALLDTLYSTAPVGLAFIDTDLCFRRVNEKLAALTGLPAGDHVGLTISQVLPDLGEQLSRPFARALEGDGGEFELRAATPGEPGVLHDWLVYYKPVRSEERILGLSCVVQDITERRRAEARTAFLARAGAVLDSSLDYTRTLQTLARTAVPDIADWCTISMIDRSGHLDRLAVVHASPEKAPLAEELMDYDPAPGGGLAGVSQVAGTGETQIARDFSEERLKRSVQHPRSIELMRALGLGEALTVALVARGVTVGVLTLVAETPSRFSREDVQLAEELARRAALSIDNARLYSERSRAARIFEASLLPRSVVRVPGLEVAVRYRPAGELSEVGGDFYDLFQRSSQEWMLVIGDVTGKGTDAAATTALIRYTLRTLAMHPGAPSVLLAQLNQAMRSQEASYCTVALVALRTPSPEAVELTVSLAGHPKPLLLGVDGRTEVIGTPGTLLGLSPDPELTDAGLRLGEGQTLLLFTDGLTDAAAPPSLTVTELIGQLQGLAGGDLEGLIDGLEAGAVARAGGRPRDDIALVALRPAPIVPARADGRQAIG